MRERLRGATLIAAATAVASTLIAVPADTSLATARDDVVINEIHYHPEDDHPDGEFIELLNRSSDLVDLSGWCIDGVKFCFPSGTTVGARQFLVTTSADWAGGLKNGGEDIALLDAAGAAVDAVEYDDKGTWPANTDGNGGSLQRRDPTADPNDPGNWVGNDPTPGRINAGIGAPMPVWDDIEHTVLPAPGEPVLIEAEVANAVRADLLYRIDFGPQVQMDLDVVNGRVAAQIPGQPAGSLIRYRLRAVSGEGVKGTWPRQGDGANNTGTTVASSNPSELPRFQWFMPDDVYETARLDLTKRGDDGYPAVFAYEGVIFDNTTVRVKGQTSRYWPKKKWKFVLPDGHELEIDGVLYEDVDEFALHSNWSDPSFMRETLASEFMERAGIPTSQAFPVRLERNDEFFGLYTYVEQRDGTFRDRQGLDDAVVYEVGGIETFGSMNRSDAFLSESALRRRYDKDTREYENDDALRQLILGLNGNRAQARAYMDEHVDIASVINLIAASVVVQHQDLGPKNFDLALNEQGLWEVYPTDFDLTFGRRPELNPCGSLCDRVYVGGSFEHPSQPLFAAIWFDPELAALLRQRIRTLTEEELVPSDIGARVGELTEQIARTGALDRQVWGTFGRNQTVEAAAAELMSNYVIPQHSRILGPLVAQGRVAPTSQPRVPAIEITNVVYDERGEAPPYVEMANRGGGLVDLSGFEIEQLDFRVRGGTFLRPGETAVAVHDDLGRLGRTFDCCIFAGLFSEDVDEQADGLVLTNRHGAVVDAWTLVPPGQYTDFSGRPGASAFVTITAVRARGVGYLQVLDCQAEAGDTSNLTHDRDGQIRAGSGVVRFDDDGRLCVFNSSETHVLVDVQGYIEPSAVDDVDDERLLDTRQAGDKRPAGSVTSISGRADSSAVVSLSAIRADGRGFLQVLGCDETPGSASNLNTDDTRQNRTSLAVVRFDAQGAACIYNSMSTHLTADLQAYLDDGAIDDIDDERILDTRRGPRPADGSQTVIVGRPGESAVVSVVAVQTTSTGYVQVLACGSEPGQASNVNSDGPGQNVSNLAIVEFDANGEACVFTEKAAHLIVDVQGYFASGVFEDVIDTRALDTRR